ncbi:DUF6265 family protein [Zeaxanthinibacter enoshimensis]|uniref:Uncharacterized protein n=1 Tax=Zeaxanthinibacter enoshimensis TaxID=392009 RepID=A0A4R6TPL5_9FLAO|nr:DUF6265 family protein [Zeaxanthinibacter enoshimensis]TDQ32207.1 hypothetical protein CLV82_0030 [Zeaxanthinibacter enoshimensis]
MRICVLILLSLALFSCQEKKEVKDHLELQSKLAGIWTAKAFDGKLYEEWKLNNDGWMQQQGYYIEKNDTTYAAVTQIQKVNEDIILFSVIENSNPKIFKAVSREENKIVFENKDYNNPFQVTYEFLSGDNYRRTIKGYENDSLVEYEFSFKKCNEP